ncbi:hypothetical protein BO219_12720 [Anoxybacillus kestanbolensis]|uniref:CBS domain-containing protein n=1 Tax=Anoxybacillus kestanbolensis TaxID=227476 RepID=A0A1V3FFS3_9BACL|nr:cyclic-di-AMP-binding protein CbpB [Anoxybacillus kestanbolensis]OOE00529.1 hypothetical protein BO219_12720 [Anoxybacillus kestanbolensis]
MTGGDYIVKGGMTMQQPSLVELMIPSDKVAHVQVGNHLEHALLVLTRTGYSAIPVLDMTYKLQGLISMTMIMDAILGIERIEFERLETMTVEQVMQKNMPRLHVNDSFLKALKLLIDHPFVCVENDDGYFVGIVTRREILKRFNRSMYEKRK